MEQKLKVSKMCQMVAVTCYHLSLTGPGDVQISPLTSPGVVPVHILTAKAQETVHAHIQASFTLLERKMQTV